MTSSKRQPAEGLGGEGLDLESYPPFYWTAIANRWTAASSQRYTRDYGIGIVEWRVMASLTALGACTAADAGRLAALDPAAAHRAMQALLKKGLVAPVAGRFVGRSKPFELTGEGRDLSRRIAEVARQRMENVIADIPESDREVFLRCLRAVYDRLSP